MEGVSVTDSITSSSELRQFAAENNGRRKIDVHAALDLHLRAANQIDLLGEHITDIQQRLAAAVSTQSLAPAPVAEAPAPAPVPVQPVGAGQDTSQAALMVLQRVQETANGVLAEAEVVRAEADRTRAEADALAELKAEAALAEARGQAAHIIEAAQERAAQVAAATAEVADRAAFAQRQYRDRTTTLKADAQSIVSLVETMETIAGEDLPPTVTTKPYTEVMAPPSTPPIPAPAPPALVEDVEARVEVPAVESDPAVEVEPLAQPVEEITPVVEEFLPAVAEVAAVQELEAANSPPAFAAAAEEVAIPAEPVAVAVEYVPTLPPPPDATLLPPPPSVAFEPAAATALVGEKDVLDLTEIELEEVLGGKSIDDELFDDEVVIDLTDEVEAPPAQDFEFFSRD
jgi:hypothetical protein